MAHRTILEKFFTVRAVVCLSVFAAFSFLTGCNGYTCVVGVINPPNNSLNINTGNIPSVCSMTQTQAAVTVSVQLAPVCTACASARQVTSTHLLLSGIEMHPGAMADENSPEWQEIAPNLARNPLPLELTRDAARTNIPLPAAVSGKVPVGAYYQIRFRLSDPSPSTVSQTSASNVCGSTNKSCVITADGNRYPLNTADGLLYLRVQATTPMEVRAGQPNLLRIELSLEWLLHSASTGEMELAPLLHGQLLSETVPSTGSL